MDTKSIVLTPIGEIRTPYIRDAPFQPLENATGDFRIVLDDRYVPGLRELGRFRYIYVIYLLDRPSHGLSMAARPPWADGAEVGLFASRSPVRPNPLGLSIVRLKKIAVNELHTSGLDAFDHTPLLDIKPYIKGLDNKADADRGWLEGTDGAEHLELHIKGIPHDRHT